MDAVAALGVAACLALAVGLAHHRLLSLSVDMALHMQEVRLVETWWVLPAWSKTPLSELWWYPKLSHRLAAGLVRLGSGEIDAMTTVGVVSAAGAWLALLAWARRAGAAVLAGGAVLAVFLALTTSAVMGDELVENFFYPQIVAEAVFWLALSAGALLLPRSRWGAVAWLTAAVLLCGWAHLLPTLKLAGAGMALLALDGVRELWGRRRLIWADAAGLVLLPAAVVSNPFFGAMRWIAANDGSVNFRVPLGPTATAGLAGVLLALTAAALLPRLRPTALTDARARASEVLAVAGAAAALAALAQYAALVLAHDGSPYAVKKHAFGVVTMLAFLLPLTLAPRLPARWRAVAPGWSVPLAACAILLAVYSRPSRLNVFAAQHLLEGVTRMQAAARIPRAKALFASDTTPPLIAFAANVVDLWHPHGEDAIATLYTGQPVTPEDEGHLISKAGDLYDVAACRERPPLAGLVLVDAACASPPAAHFGAGQPGVAFLREGWAGPEKGVWSQAPRAVVDLPLPAGAASWPAGWLVASTFSFTPPQSPHRTATLSAGGRSETFRFGPDTAISHDYVLPLDGRALRGGHVRVTFDIPDAVSPQALGLGNDPRKLGVGLEQIRILPDRRPPA